MLKKVHRAIKFNQKAWLKLSIDRYEYWFKESSKNNFEKDFYKLMNIWVFCKTMQNVWKHRNNKLETTTKKETSWCQNQINILQIFLEKICWLWINLYLSRCQYYKWVKHQCTSFILEIWGRKKKVIWIQIVLLYT